MPSHCEPLNTAAAHPDASGPGRCRREKSGCERAASLSWAREGGSAGNYTGLGTHLPTGAAGSPGRSGEPVPYMCHVSRASQKPLLLILKHRQVMQT